MPDKTMTVVEETMEGLSKSAVSVENARALLDAALRVHAESLYKVYTIMETMIQMEAGARTPTDEAIEE